MGRRPQVLEQGHLDGLCGVYSVVNGITWALHTIRSTHGSATSLARPLRHAEEDELFALLLRAIVRKRTHLRSVIDGINSVQLSHLLRCGSGWLANNRGLHMNVVRPFYRRPRVATRVITRRLAAHLDEPGTAAIIGVDPPLRHWTVVTRVARTRLVLFDSSGDSHVPLRQFGRHWDRDIGFIRPSTLFLLRVQLPI